MNTNKPPRTKGGVVHPSTQRSLEKLGQDIALARRARRISAQDMASRMSVDRGTLRRLEQGDPGVSLNTLAMALSVLGLLDRLMDMVDRTTDEVGLMVSRGDLPKRVRRSVGRSERDRSTPEGDEPEGW